jgi:rhomboid family protein
VVAVAAPVPAAGPVSVPAGGSLPMPRWLRWSRIARGTVAAAPVTTAVVIGLLVIVTLISTQAVDADALQQWASTNLVNLYHHPISAMVLSAFVLTGPSTAGIGVAAAVCGLFERRVGTKRLLAVAAAGQVIPSLITEGAVRLAIHAGGESRAAAVRFDAGISYVTFSVAAALTKFAPARWRRTAVLAGVSITVIQFAVSHDMTASGHALAFGVGLLCWPLLERRGQAPVVPRTARRHVLVALAAMALVGLLAVYLPVQAFGLHPLRDHTVVTGLGWGGSVP